ncbi:NUOA9 [Auxenochlorella protothecoides x Auxenochlorella symbiontica]|uniref:NAD-dependent epimerase/dehydratase domain-containing protein n=1 Tax=Auxenochlorella protothecoides TaxID=3075 RepID=A0A1D2ADF0_AUXPR
MSRATMTALRALMPRHGAAVEASSRGMATYPSELAIRTNSAIQGGKGGRSSVSGVTATIFGCSGFLGRYIAQSLARIGCQLVFPHRCDDLDVQHLRPMGDLGQVVMLPNFNPRDDDAYRRAISRSNVVINLIGADQETWNYGFKEVHVDIPARIAKAVREHGGVERVLHFSNIAARPDAVSQRLRTKGEGEALVRSELGDLATIFKVAPVTGTEDRVFNQLARLIKAYPALPLVAGGALRLQPVWVRDVAQAVFNSMQEEGAAGKTYALAGPEVLTLSQLADLTYHTIREPHNVLPVPEKLAELASRPLGWLGTKTPFRANPFFSSDSVAELARGDFTLAAATADQPLLTIEDLGVAPRRVTEGHPIEFLRYYRSGGYDMGAVAEVDSAPTPARWER